MEEDLDIQLFRVVKNIDFGIQSESEDEEYELLNGELEFVFFNREEEGEGEVYDVFKLILFFVGESSIDDILFGNVEFEEDEEEEEEDLEEKEEEEEEEEKVESEDDSEGEDMEDQI